jgi:predicted XRE-type DNA-binding protein
MAKTKFHIASENIFADLGIPQPEEALAKADVARQLISIVKARGLTQTETARILGIDQPKVSALLRGRLGGFSMERLMRFLVLLGQQVEVLVKEPVQSRPTLRVFSPEPIGKWPVAVDDPGPQPEFVLGNSYYTPASSRATVVATAGAMIEDRMFFGVGAWLPEFSTYYSCPVPSQESAWIIG